MLSETYERELHPHAKIHSNRRNAVRPFYFPQFQFVVLHVNRFVVSDSRRSGSIP